MHRSKPANVSARGHADLPSRVVVAFSYSAVHGLELVDLLLRLALQLAGLFLHSTLRTCRVALCLSLELCGLALSVAAELGGLALCLADDGGSGVLDLFLGGDCVGEREKVSCCNEGVCGQWDVNVPPASMPSTSLSLTVRSTALMASLPASTTFLRWEREVVNEARGSTAAVVMRVRVTVAMRRAVISARKDILGGWCGLVLGGSRGTG